MEINQPLDGDFGALQLTAESRGYIQECARWGSFFGIIGFVFSGIMVLMTFSVGTVFSSVFQELGETGTPAIFGGGLMAAFFAFYAILLFFPSLYIYRFGKNTTQALKYSNTIDLTEGLKNLKSNFKFWGILWVVITGFYAIIFVIGLLGSL